MVVNKPSIYYADGKVTVYKNGVFFYETKNKRFNLPIGVYEIFGNIILCGHYKHNYNLKPFEKLEYKNFNFYYGNNPNYASVWDNGDVLIDKKFKNLDIVNLLLKAHEIGHSFYNTELDCDLFAKEILKSLGFNNSQIDAAFKSIVYTDRVKHIHKTLIK